MNVIHEEHTCRDCGCTIVLPYAKPLVMDEHAGAPHWHDPDGVTLHYDHPDGTLPNALRHASDTNSRLIRENQRLREALQRIVNLDYRGHPSMEQGIAKAALA